MIERSCNEKLEKYFRNNPNVKKFLKSVYSQVNITTHTERISDKMYRYLEEIYGPYNLRLFRFHKNEAIQICMNGSKKV